MRILASLRSLIREQARASMYRECAHDVTVSRVDVTPGRTSSGVTLQVTFELKSRGEDSRPLLFERAACPWPIHNLRCTAATDESHRAVARNTWMLRLQNGNTWDAAVLEFQLHWPEADAAGGQITCISLPDHLPQVISLEAFGRVPEVLLRSNASGIRAVGYLEDHCSALRPLQVVLSRDPMKPSSLQERVRIVGRLADDASIGERQRIERLIGRVLDFHSEFFSKAAEGVIAVVPSESAPVPARGAMLRINSIKAFGLAGQSYPDDVMLGSRLASLWWGTGCRLSGRHARELEASIRAATGMLWADYVDGPYRGNVLRDWTTEASASRITDGWARATGAFAQGLHCRWNLALYMALQRESRVRDVLQSLTAEHWGWHTDADYIRTELASAGVALN